MDAARPIATAARVGAKRIATARPYTPIYRCLHTSDPKPANALPVTATGPPPGPPRAAAGTAEERVARKKKQIEMIERGKELRANPAKPASALKKRFWGEVSVKESPDGLQVHLDTRPVRTAAKNILTLPPNKFQLASAIALEWDMLTSAQQALKQHYIPMTSLTSRAIDIQAADAKGDTSIRENIINMMMRYLTTDTLLCWAPERSAHEATGLERRDNNGETLRELQARVAQPIISFLTTKLWPGVEIVPVLESDSILPAQQPQMTKDVVKGWISGLPAFELAGLERGVLASKSLLIAARLLVEWSQEFGHVRSDQADGKKFGIEEAAEACSLEVRWQTGMWGEVEDSHDVEREDMRRQLGSVVILVHG
ncbi:ATP12-domain-containing protein [Saccharata proteae CBS 121410]|uniref:ATP12-domain-containing protein n=1 Tax=Saccharata proteae CBS 121410 TaxID=1314787 RepID=A0A9P4HSZ5_9PEZI|nr:ATP12-domain-containing protein [Saccharata proteae CBS 121410]